MPAVAHHRIGGHDHTVARQPEPPAQVHILVQGEEIGIEPSQFQKDPPVHQHRPATRKKDLVPARRLLDGQAQILLQAVAQVMQGGPVVVDAPAFPVQDSRRHARCPGRQLLQRGGQPGRFGAHVVVDEGDAGPPRRLSPQVAGLREAVVDSVLQQSDLGIMLPEEPLGAVGAPVVHHDHLARFQCQQGRKQGGQVGLAVPVDGDDRDVTGGWGHGAIVR